MSLRFSLKIRAWLSAAVIAALASGCIRPHVAFNAHADFGSIHRVAVATFGGPGGDVAADFFTQGLLERGADVVERQRLEALLHEQHLAAANILDPSTVKMM